MSIEVMKQALEALKYHMEQTRPINMTQNAIHALRQAIEQAEKQGPDLSIEANRVAYEVAMHYANKTKEMLSKPEQEPVAWVDKVWVERLDIAKQLRIELLFSRCQLSHNQIPLYTAPPKREWVGLTDAELAEFSIMKLGAYDLCLEVEAKLMEKNT